MRIKKEAGKEQKIIRYERKIKKNAVVGDGSKDVHQDVR